MKNTLLNMAVGICMIASVAQAVPTWPASWTAVTIGGNNYTDGHNDPVGTDPNYSTPPAPEKCDIVGNSTTPTAYYAYDSQNMYFRIRVDGNPVAGGAPQNVWSVVLNTDADITADWVIQWDMTGDNQVELARATGGSPTDVTPWSALAYNIANQTTPSGGVATDWYRYVNTGDSTTFPDTPAGTDYFVDIAFDKATFDATLTAASETPVDSFSVVFASSAQHQLSNKDLPDQGWSDTITVPEPTSMVLLALGVTVLAMRRRKV